MPDNSAEQEARNLLQRHGVEDAQTWSAGGLVELANLIDDANAYRRSKTFGSVPNTETGGYTLTLDVDSMKALLKVNDYVVLKSKSYRQAQERQRVAEIRAKSAEEDAQNARYWAQTTLHNEIRDLMARCTFLYGLARAQGATAEELNGGWKVVGVNLPIERTETLQCHCGTHPYIITDYDARPITRFVCPEHGLVASTDHG